MENSNFNETTNFQEKLPNATLVIVLGVFSIILSCCCSIFGSILGLIGLIVANNSISTYNNNPKGYNNYNDLKTGKILNIIGIIIGILSLGLAIYQIQAIGGWDAYVEEIKTIIEEAQNAQ